jgi:hypothetical protein
VQPLQLVVLLVVQALLLLTLAGLWRRRRARRLWMLPVHLLATVAAQTLTLAAPQVFRAWSIWATREVLLHTLTLGIVVEIAWRVFPRTPGRGRRLALFSVGLALLAPPLLVALIPWDQRAKADVTFLSVVVIDVLPRLSYGLVFTCFVLAWAMRRLILPFDPLHWAVVFGLGAYLTVYSVAIGTLPSQPRTVLSDALTPLAYTLLMTYWAWAAWRTEKPVPVHPEVRHVLQSWRDE